MLIQSNCVAVSGIGCCNKILKTTISPSAKLVGNKYKIVLRILSYKRRPCAIATLIVEKSSLAKTISAEFLATSVPLIPMAMPISAFFKAGASFTPSPVMAVTKPLA